MQICHPSVNEGRPFHEDDQRRFVFRQVTHGGTERLHSCKHGELLASGYRADEQAIGTEMLRTMLCEGSPWCGMNRVEGAVTI